MKVIYCLLFFILKHTCWSMSHFGLSFASSVLKSPCPDIFHYFIEGNMLKYGIIQVEPPQDTNIELNVRILIGNPIEDGYNGDLKLFSDRSQTIDDVLNRRPIKYRLNFPRWVNMPPQIIKIILNEKLLCSSSPNNVQSFHLITTVDLHHSLKVTLPLSTSNFIPNMRFDSVVPFSSIQPTVIDFNPATPKDPSKIYQGTPFLHAKKQTPQTPPNNQQLQTSPITEELYTTQEPKIQRPQSTQTTISGRFRDHGINSKQCGYSITTQSLIAHGTKVTEGQYPWLAALFVPGPLGPEFACGGNLISKKHVITAAHCVKISGKLRNVEEIFFKLGQLNINRWTNSRSARTTEVAKIIVHPEYTRRTADADIALMIFAEEVDYTPTIRPICLWDSDNKLENIVSNVGTVAGWGRDENSKILPEPKQVEIPIVSQEVCLRSDYNFKDITSERTFCAGYINGSGPCSGDSGSGYIMQVQNQWTLRGIVSMSLIRNGVCDNYQYIVFTDVAKFLNWISESLGT